MLKMIYAMGAAALILSSTSASAQEAAEVSPSPAPSAKTVPSTQTAALTPTAQADAARIAEMTFGDHIFVASVQSGTSAMVDKMFLHPNLQGLDKTYPKLKPLIAEKYSSSLVKFFTEVGPEIRQKVVSLLVEDFKEQDLDKLRKHFESPAFRRHIATTAQLIRYNAVGERIASEKPDNPAAESIEASRTDVTKASLGSFRQLSASDRAYLMQFGFSPLAKRYTATEQRIMREVAMFLDGPMRGRLEKIGEQAMIEALEAVLPKQ